MMEEVKLGDSDCGQMNANGDSFDDEEEDLGFPPRAERWAPIGASAPDISSPAKDSSENGEMARLKQLEEEQEQLNSSLLSLTTHFAQVQFRLQQISKAPPENKESGEGGLPSGELMEKQRVLIDQLRDRMDWDFDGLDKLSKEDIQKHVDSALKKLINPMKVKEQLVIQLKTQITDLERFIEFLQGEGVSFTPTSVCTCKDSSEKGKYCPKHSAMGRLGGSANTFGFSKDKEKMDSHSNMVNLVTMYILSQMGCGSKKFQKNELKKTTKGNHWGDLRAELEICVDKLIAIMDKHEQDEVPATLHPYNSDEEDVDDVFEQCHEEVVTCVRKDFCPALRNLLQHGLIDPNVSQYTGSGLGTLGCLPIRSKRTLSSSSVPSGSDQPKLPLHAWDVVLKYYDMKHGREYSDAPVRKLSQSFNLENIGGRAITSKQMLLTAIDNIISSHTKLKRSQDAMFKAFVSAALNHRKLVPWLRMILRTREIIEENYYAWSYTSRTGFDDSFSVLEKLNRFTFRLPVDLAVRPFQHIKDAF